MKKFFLSSFLSLLLAVVCYGQPNVAAPAPTVNASLVTSIFSDAFTNVSSTNFNPNWGQATVTSEVLIAGNNTLKLAGLNYQGINIGSADGTNQNLTTKTTLHLDYWTSDASIPLQVFLISRTSGEKFFSCTITKDTWVSVDIPLSSYTAQALLISDIYQFKFVGNGTFYIDNIYFYSEVANPAKDATLSDLKVAGATVAGFAASNLTYNVVLPVGTTSVPAVTATSNVVGAGVVITPAASLPGSSTVVVTSTDLSTTKVYTIAFTVAVPAVNLPVDFENTTAGFYGLTDFGGNTSSIVADPTNASNKVVKSIKAIDAATWAGTTVGGANGTTGFGNKIPFVTGSTKMSVRVYSPAAGIHVRLKVENSADGTMSVETEALSTVANAWETLVFDFTVPTVPPTAGLDVNKTYNKASIFFNFGTDGAAGVKTFYWDDMKFGDGTISSDAALSDLKVDGTTVPGFSATVLSYNVVLAAGTTVVPTITATSNNTNAKVVITPAASLPGTSTVVVTAENGLATKTYSVAFTVLSNANNATLSALKVDGTTVAGFSSSLLSYSVVLPVGTTVVPTVTAVSTIPGAGVVVTPAASIPGISTVVVTATDGTTKITYSVAFAIVGAVAPIVAAPVPTAAAADVISIYGDAYNNLANTNFNPNWGQATQFSEVTIAGKKTIKLIGLNYQGVALAGNTDFSSMKFLHVDYWTADATTSLWVQLISKSANASVPYKSVVTQNSWVSVDIPLNYYNVPLTDIFQLEFQVEKVPASDGTFYLQNIYFYTTPVAPANNANLSDLKVSGATVAGFNSLIQTYNVQLPAGTSTVPPVTATCVETGSIAVVTPASSLPGTSTVVVTAQDGTTTKTYNVVFTIAPVVLTVAAPVPTVAAANVISVFSDAYTNLANTNFNPNWGQATVTSEVLIAGNNTLKLADLNYQGINIGGADGVDQNLSTMSNLHFDYWTSNASLPLQVFLISRNAPTEMPYPITITKNSWVSVDIPLSAYISQGMSMNAIYQFKFVGTGTIYLDNIYFNKIATGIKALNSDDQNISIYPNPVENELNIKSNSALSKVAIYNVIGMQVKEFGNVLTVNVNDLKSGVYFIRLTDTKGISVSSKFIKK